MTDNRGRIADGAVERSSSERTGAWKRAALAFLVVTPVVFVVWFLAGVDPNPPIADEWELVAFFGRVVSGEAGLRDWLAPHNGLHVIVVGRAILMGLAYLTNWNLRAELCLSLAVVLTTFLLVRRLELDTFQEEGLARDVCAVFTMALLLAPEEHRIWLWPIGFFHYFENALFIGALVALTRPSPRIKLALFLCVVATFNRIEAIFMWVVLFPFVRRAVAAKTAGRRKVLVSWAVIGAVCSATSLGTALLLGTKQPGLTSHGARMFVARLGFALNLMGSAPASFTEARAANVPPTYAFVGAGGLGFASFAALAVHAFRNRTERVRAAPWLCIGTFGLVFCGAAAMGRAALLDSAAMDQGSHLASAAVPALVRQFLDWCVSAYSATASFVAIAAVHLLAIRLERVPSRRARTVFGTAATAFGLVVGTANYAHALPLLLAKRAAGHAGRYCVELAAYWEPVNACLMPRNSADLLQKAHLRGPRTGLSLKSRNAAVHATVTEIPETRWEVARTRVAGWVPSEFPETGTVLLGAPDEKKFVAHATAVTRSESRISFVIDVPHFFGRPPKRTLRAYWYNPKRSRIEVLQKDIEL